MSGLKFPPNAGKPWTPAQDAQLRALVRSGLRVPNIAAELGRTVAGTEARVQRLGLTDPWSELLSLAQELLEYEAEQFDGPGEDNSVDGGDLVEWFIDFRDRLHSTVRLIEGKAVRP